MSDRIRDPQNRDRPSTDPFNKPGHPRLNIKDVQYIKQVEDAMSDFAPTFSGGFNAGQAVVGGPVNYLQNGSFENDVASPPSFWSTSTPAGGGTSTLTTTVGSLSTSVTDGSNFAEWTFQVGKAAFEADAVTATIPEYTGAITVDADLAFTMGGITGTVTFQVALYDDGNNLLATLTGDTLAYTDAQPYVTFTDSFDLASYPTTLAVGVSIILNLASNTAGGENASLDNVRLLTASSFTGLHKGKLGLTSGSISGNLTVGGNLKVLGTTNLSGGLISNLVFKNSAARSITNAGGTLTLSTAGAGVGGDMIVNSDHNWTLTCINGGTVNITAPVIGLHGNLATTGTAVLIEASSTGEGDVVIQNSNGFGQVLIQDAGGGINIKAGTLGSSMTLQTQLAGGIILDATSTGTVALLSHTAKHVTIQGVPIEPTGGNTGYVLTQQSDGSFTPAAVSASSLSLTTNHIYVGVSGVATDVAMSGDATIVASGALTIAAGAVTGSKIASSAALAGSPTTTTQTRVDNSTKIATTAYADRIRLVCTSSTHPSSPSAGDEIYETDTGKTLIYQGATDTWTPPWNTAWGFIGIGTTTTDVTGIGAAQDCAGTSITFTAVANRRYLVEFVICVAHATNGSGAVELGIYDSSNALVGADIVGVEVFGSNGQFTMAKGLVESPSGGSITRKVRINASGTGGVLFGSSHPGYLLIQDIGPNGAPS